MSDIQITFQDLALGANNVKHISFVGQLDETNVDHEAKRIYQVITEMAVPILFLDFSGLEYMNSKSIGYVTDWFSQATAKQGSISIIAPKPNILDILKVVGITQIITIYNSLEEAKTALGSAPVSGAAPATEAPAAAETEAPATPTAPAAPEAPAAAETEAPATPAAPAAPEAPATPEPTAEPAPVAQAAAPSPVPAAPETPEAPAAPDTADKPAADTDPVA